MKKSEDAKRNEVTVKGHGLYQTLANTFFGGNKLYEGEKHVPQLTWNFKEGLRVKNANFSGPGTNLIQRLQKGDRGITQQDKAANAHDIRYNMAKNEEDIRKADKKMVSTLAGKLSFLSPVESINNLVAMAGIGGKMLLDKLGITNTNTYTSFGDYEELPKHHQQLLKSRLDELEKEGYGQHKGVKRLKKWMFKKKR